jgi:hypothetical protein
MLIYIDIDNTIFKTDGTNYSSSTPIIENIQKVNNMYDDGHIIVMWTARGTLSNKCFFELTHEQLIQFGVKFHELRMGKPAYDLFIDDKSINSMWDWTDKSMDYFIEKNNVPNNDKNDALLS